MSFPKNDDAPNKLLKRSEWGNDNFYDSLVQHSCCWEASCSRAMLYRGYESIAMQIRGNATRPLAAGAAAGRTWVVVLANGATGKLWVCHRARGGQLGNCGGRSC